MCIPMVPVVMATIILIQLLVIGGIELYQCGVASYVHVCSLSAIHY